MARTFSFEDALRPRKEEVFSFEEAMGIKTEPTFLGITPGQFAEAAVPEFDLVKRGVSSAIQGAAGAPAGIEAAVRAPVRKIMGEGLLEQSELYQLGRRLFGKEPTEEELEQAKARKIEIDRSINQSIPLIPGLQELAEGGRNVSDFIRERQSPEALEAERGSRMQGNLLEAVTTGDFSKLSFGENPTLYGYALQGADVLGSLLPVVIAGALGPKSAAVVGGGMAAGEAAQNAKEFVKSKSDVELAAASPYYKDLITAGVPPEEAREIIADRAAEQAAFLQGSVAAVGGAATQKLISGSADKIINAAGRNRLMKIAVGGTLVGLEEGTQEFLEGIAADLGISAEVIKEIGEDSFANFVLGFIGGAPVGAVRGALPDQQPPAQPPGQAPPGQAPTTSPTTPPGTQPASDVGLLPGMVQPEPELTPEDEAELQARIAAVPPAAPPAAPPAGIAPILPPGPPPAPAPAAAPIPTEEVTPIAGFETSLGSTYTLDEQGRSSRTKKSPGKGQGKTYAPHSVFYVTPEDSREILADKVGGNASIRLGYELDGKFRPIRDITELPAGSTPLVAVVDNDSNTLRGFYRANMQPAVGLAPVEKLYNDDGTSNTHVGNPITKIIPRPQTPATPVEQLQQSGTVALQQLQPGETVPVQQPPVVEPSIEESIRAQKTEERRQRQADEQARKGEFILQNRDRSTDASIEQMALIALDPDYARAGFSRTPDGAPVVSYGAFNPEQMGREDIVTTASGRKIPVQYAVVEADEVLSSNDLQGRPNPDYGNKEVMGTRAIAGNGRITGLREAFNRGNAGQYVQDMIGDSALHGVNPDVINSMQKPVLVRVMPQDQLTKDIGDDLNKSSMLELSPAEKARNDLNRVDLDALDFKENGEISNESLNQFIQAQPVEERPTLLDNGLPTKQARQRLENAIFARAYNDKSLISMFAQADDPEARLVINAMARVAPQMAKLEGAGDLDIRDIVTDAAKIIISGKRRGLKLSEIAAQVDMTVDPDTRIIVDLFAQNPRSNKAAVEALTNAATVAYEESIKPAEGLFGVEPKIERRELIERMRRDYEPGRTEDVAQAQRPGAAPSDVEGAPEPSPPTVPPADQEFVLTGETEAEIRAKQAAIDQQKKREREERLAAERKAQADAERDSFVLSGSDLPTDEAIARGQQELTAAEPTEAEAAKIPPIEKAIEDELKKAGYDDLTKMSKQIKDEFGVSKPVADAYARAVQNARIQHVRAQYGEITAEQLMEALNARDSLRRRIDGIVKRRETAKPREGRPVEVQTWDVFYTGTNNLAAENVEAPSAQKAKQIAAEKEGLKSIARLTAKKKEKKLTGAYRLAIRQQNAADSFVNAVVEQFELTEEQAQNALNRLMKEKVVSLDPVDGQFKLKDGRFWDKEVMLRAAGVDTEAKPEPKKEPEAKKESKGPTPGELKNIQYWQANVAPAIRDYLEAYKTVGAERLERSNIKPAGVSPKQWLIQLRDQESKFEKGRKVSETGIQMLSKKDLWPTETGDGEVLRKAMLKAIQELKKAPGYSSNWIDNMELGSYDGVSGYAPVADKTVFGIASDGIDGYEVDPSQVPNGSDAFQYVVGRVEKDGKEEVYRRRADERGTFGGWRVETSVDKLLPKKPAALKEPSAGPTFAGMQAEIERLKAEAKAMGIELDQQTFVRDTAAEQEKKAKKEAKKRELRLKQATRNEIEYARFDDLSTDPIQATPEQLKLAKQLADDVNGELVFYDKDLNLGLVTVANKMGFDDYFPIHDGIISKVDVSDYTGLSVMDKSFLKRIKNSLEILKGTSGKMLAGTEDEQKGIRSVAEAVGGTPVYFDPKRNVGLVRGYSSLTGDPIYAISIGSQYSRVDVEATTAPALLPYKAELTAIKKRLEEEAAKKHKDDPFIKFDRGISLSDGIDSSFKGIITEWKSMLGLDNVNIYFSTVEDARKNRDNFTGPHRSIGSGTLDANEAGSMRRMADGSYYVLFKEKISKSKMLETIAHEIGHVHEREAYRNAPQDLKNKLQEAHAKWLQQRKDKTSREAVEMLRAKTTAQTTKIGDNIRTARELDQVDRKGYWSSFSEWYADQVSRWAVTDEKPVGVVEKFFARLGAALRRFYQTLKGQRYLPDETFVEYLNQVKPVIVETIPGPVKEPVQIEMSFQMQKDLFGSTSEAKQIGEIMEVKGKKLPPGRSPELTAAARAVQAGTMSAEEYNKLVDVYKPIPIYAEPLRPATAEQVFDALDVKKREQINPEIPNGTKVGLRLDIPAFNRKGVFVVSIHQKRTASSPGKVIGYGSVAKAKNVTFGVGNQLKALEIAAGAAKDALQTIEGEYVNVSPEQAFAEAQRAIKDPSYVQVGIDPTRHAYFYDRRTTLPVVSAEEVIQIGNMILAKNPTFGKKADFLYNIEGGPIAGDTQPDDMSFLDRLRKEESEKREIERQEKIAYYASIRRKEVVLQQRVRDYGSTLETQRQLNNLNQIAQALKEDIDLDKQPVYTAENFMRQARAALDGTTPYKEQAISPDVFAVIQAIYMDDPRLLEGLRLSIKPEFSKRDEELRRAFGIRAAAGAFQPLERIVNLYTGTKGVTDPTVIRHELTHTLEQMMTGPQRMAIFNSYMDALKKAIKKNKDPKAQEFFDNVLKFLDKPTAQNKEAVNKTTPSYALYQFVNPSEYWAVNAEKLMAQRLGTSWDRFKKAVRKMFEKMKDIFGFNNQFAVHDVFDKIMSGSKERLGRDSIAAYIASSGEQFEFLNSIKDDSDLIAKYRHGDTPMLDVAPAKRIMLKTAQNAKDSFKEMVENPSEILRMTFNPLLRGITYVRNKFIWFGTGLNEADRIRYNGQVRTAEGLATASLALDNMIRGGNIATQVLFQGGIEYNPNTLMFGAVKKEKNMTKVYKAEAALKKKLGDQLGTNIAQGYFIAKRSKNIKDDVEYHEMALENVNEDIDLKVQELKALDANPNATEKQKKAVNRELRSLFAEAKQIQKDYETIKKIAEDKVTMSDTEIEDFIAREKVHPELKEMLDNFTAVNQNLLKFWRQVGLQSQPRYERLAAIKEYVPWYRIMADEEDVHSPLQATTRSATNIGKEKLFGPGKPSVVDDFVIEENQNVFKIQPAKVNAVKLNSKRLKPGEYEITQQGEMTLKVPYKPGDVLIIQSERQIENIIDNMTRNVMRMTMNGLRQYAAQRIVSEYATRDADGKIMTFKEADLSKGRFDFINNGRRTVVEIQDPLIAEAALGMQTVGMQMWKPLAAAANFTRRTITLSPVFQVRQVFKDAPTAALVTGVKNPAALVGGVYKGFISALRDSDPASSILRSAGIGGFYSPARTPEADVKRQIGIINNSTYDYVIKALDHVGDSSDIAQRIAIYNRVMAETGDEALALYQSANVINFLRHGSGQVAQALVQTVPFLNAYAQSIDVLYNALVGGGLRGLDRKKAMQRLFVTGSLLAGTTILYAMLVGDDDEYMKMDDQSKIRNYMIPGTDVILPMNTSAAFFFKAIPELVYNKVVNEGTENAVDEKRLRTALKEAAVDLLLGPTPIPSAVKPVVEISLNRDFFTSRPVVPAGLQDLDAYQQYDMRTSDAGKFLSALTGTEANRLLNPIEADHLIRGIFGTVGGMVAWSSNLIGTSADYRPEMGLKEMPITGAFLRPEVPRGREDLFYALKESTDRKFRTYDRLADRDPAEAMDYLNRNPNLIAFYDYTSQMDTELKEINAAVRFIAETTDPSYTPAMKREEIQRLLNLKQDILEGVEMFRREAYAR